MSTIEYQRNNKYQKVYQIFGKKKIFLPVVHVVTMDQVKKNIEILSRLDIQGCWIINHSCSDDIFSMAYNFIKTDYPKLWVGINYLSGNPLDPINFCLKYSIYPNGFWFDNIGVLDDNIKVAEYITKIIKSNNFDNVLIFGSICFKYQIQPKNVSLTTQNAMNFVDIITTSGKGTGQEHEVADINKFNLMKSICDGHNYLAVASGISESNILNIIESVDIFMVNSSIALNEIFIEEKLLKLKNIINLFNN